MEREFTQNRKYWKQPKSSSESQRIDEAEMIKFLKWDYLLKNK